MFGSGAPDSSSGKSSPSASKQIFAAREKENSVGALYNQTSTKSSKTHTIPMNTLDGLTRKDSSTKWEDLRRQARHIEQDLDVKLVSFSKLGSSSTSGGNSLGDKLTDGRHRSPHSALDFDNEIDSQSAGQNASNDDMFKTMAMEITSLLSSLEGINQNLADFSQKNSQSSSGSSGYANPAYSNNTVHGNAAMLHTLQRHRDILQDFQSEFNKIKSNIEAQRQREDLLGSVRRDIDMHYRQQQQMKSRTGLGESTAATESFMNERARLLNSEKLTQEAIQMGLNTRESLREQRGQFAGLTNRVQGVMQKFPMINSLVHRINWRKKRDSLILAGVISVCTFLLLLYWLRL